MRFLLLISAILIYSSCSSESRVAGTATDTENTLAGVVLTSDQSVAAGASVHILSRKVGYGESSVLFETKADSAGRFAFEEMPEDSFDLEIHLLDDSGEMLEVGVVRDLSIQDTSFLKVSLTKPGVLVGHFNYEENIPEITIGSAFRFSVERSGIQAHIFAGDSFMIPIIPGNINFAFYPSDDQVVLRLQSDGFGDSLVYQEFSVFVESGDTLDLGDVKWVIEEKTESPWKKNSYLAGYVRDSVGNPISGAVVRLISDIYGLSFALSGKSSVADFVYTDKDGFWIMPFPAKMERDSIRIETELNNGHIAESSFISASDLKENEGDTLWIENLEPREPSSINLNVRLVVNLEDTTQVDNCYMNSVVVGLVGTSKFKRIVTCAPMDLPGLPSGVHSFVFYTSDMTVLNVLQERGEPMDSYMRFMDVNLTPGAVLDRQWITYTPPTL